MQNASRAFVNIDAEHSVIGCFLLADYALREAAALSAEDFTDTAAKSAFKAVQRVMVRKEPVDLVTVDAEMQRMGMADHLNALVDMAHCVPSAATVGAYVKIVREMADRRKIRDIAMAAIDAISDPQSDTAHVLGTARNSLRSLTKASGGSMDIAELLLKTRDRLERLNAGEIVPIKSGLPALDRKLGGFFPGEFTVIGARPAVGKSAFGLNVALDAAKHDFHATVVSLEMYPDQYGQRLISRGSGINGMKLRVGDIDGDAWAGVYDAIQQYSSLPMHFEFECRSIESIIAAAQRRADAGELDILLIDYLQLIRTEGKFESERVRVGHISHELKQLAKDLGVPVVALAQLSRPPKGTNYVPRMADLRESGDIEQDADGIILLHRPEKYDDPGVDPRDAMYFDELTAGGRQYTTIIVDKQRQGEIGIINAIFDPSVMDYKAIQRG